MGIVTLGVLALLPVLGEVLLVFVGISSTILFLTFIITYLTLRVHYEVRENALIKVKKTLLRKVENLYFYKDWESVQMRKGPIDRFLGVGDIEVNAIERDEGFVIKKVKDVEKLVEVLRKKVKTVHT